jgi:hypothetical protein
MDGGYGLTAIRLAAGGYGLTAIHRRFFASKVDPTSDTL